LSKRSAFTAFVVATRTSLSHPRRIPTARINWPGAAKIDDLRPTRHKGRYFIRAAVHMGGVHCRADEVVDSRPTRPIRG